MLMQRKTAEKGISWLEERGHEHSNTGGRRRGGGGDCKEGARSRCSEVEVIYTAHNLRRYEKWATVLPSYHTVASASDHHCLSIFACILFPSWLGKTCDMTARASIRR